MFAHSSTNCYKVTHIHTAFVPWTLNARALIRWSLVPLSIIRSVQFVQHWLLLDDAYTQRVCAMNVECAPAYSVIACCLVDQVFRTICARPIVTRWRERVYAMNVECARAYSVIACSFVRPTVTRWRERVCAMNVECVRVYSMITCSFVDQSFCTVCARSRERVLELLFKICSAVRSKNPMPLLTDSTRRIPHVQTRYLHRLHVPQPGLVGPLDPSHPGRIL